MSRGRLVAKSEDIRICLAQNPIVSPLNLRDTFFGGQTNAALFCTGLNPNKGEQIRYVDVTSLYPWVNKYRDLGYEIVNIHEVKHALPSALPLFLVPHTHLFFISLFHSTGLDFPASPNLPFRRVR